MNPEIIIRLFEIVKEKQLNDNQHDWSNDSATFINEIKSEICEVEEEIRSGRPCYLEDELGDVFWDYINLLQSLENEKKIKLERVFERSFQKYSERWNALQSGTSWKEVKVEQKRKLALEYESGSQK